MHFSLHKNDSVLMGSLALWPQFQWAEFFLIFNLGLIWKCRPLKTSDRKWDKKIAMIAFWLIYSPFGEQFTAIWRGYAAAEISIIAQRLKKEQQIEIKGNFSSRMYQYTMKINICNWNKKWQKSSRFVAIKKALFNW